MTVMSQPTEPPEDAGEPATKPLSTVSTIAGPARVGSPRDLTARARPGDVLVIDVQDLRESDAEALAATGAAAVVNAQRTASGRQPAAGARRLLDAGVVVIDGAGPAVLAVRDGAPLTLTGNAVVRGSEVIARGTALTAERVVAADTAALDHLKVQVAVFGSHALERLEREGALFFEGVGLPALDVANEVVLVVAGTDAAADLRRLRLFLRDRRPLVIAEGGAVDACLAARLRPQVIIGDLDGAPDSALRAARVIALPSDAAVLPRLQGMGATYEESPVALAGADLAALAAHHGGADVVVMVGRRSSAVDVLSADAEQGIGAFLTALVTRRGSVDAEVLAATYRHRHSLVFVWTVVTLAAATLAVALWSVPDIRDAVTTWWASASQWLGGDS